MKLDVRCERLTSRAFCRVSGVMVKLTGVGKTLAFCGCELNQDTVTMSAMELKIHFEHPSLDL